MIKDITIGTYKRRRRPQAADPFVGALYCFWLAGTLNILTFVHFQPPLNFSLFLMAAGTGSQHLSLFSSSNKPSQKVTFLTVKISNGVKLTFPINFLGAIGAIDPWSQEGATCDKTNKNH